MWNSDLSRPDQDFDLFDQEKGIILQATHFLENGSGNVEELKATLKVLIRAFQLSAREQKQLMRAGDRQQEQLRLVGRELKEKSRLLEDQARHLLVLNTDLAHEVEARKTLEVELRILASTDPLTGVYNRRRFLELGDYEWTREARNHRGLCLLALDIDLFKKVNDTHGHSVGDETLKRFVQTCSGCLRAMDTIARIGGEEFAILLPETNLPEACEIAERMRTAVAAVQISAPQGPFQITVSIGVCQLGAEGETFDDLMARADAELYLAKNNGRNRVHGG